MPEGKPAGIRCIQLDERNLCRLFGQPERPDVCLQFGFDDMVCGDHNTAAMDNLIQLETITG